MIHIHAGEPVANGAVEQRGRHGAVDAAAQAQQHRALAYLLANFLHGDFGVCLHAPIALEAAEII